MKIIEPSHEILTPIDGMAILKHIERCGRVCYKSEDKITEDSCKKFVVNIIKHGHESVLEHFSISVKFICDRGVSHELVRQRLASFSQESTRYCNYSDGKFNSELVFIIPSFFKDNDEMMSRWRAICAEDERTYMKLIKMGASPQEARTVLPNSLKTEIVVTANLREWRHILKLRTSPAAHPQIVEIMKPLLVDFHNQIPVLFDDIYEKVIAA